MSDPMTRLNELRDQGLLTWSEGEQGWTGAPAEILAAQPATLFIEIDGEALLSP